MEELVSKHENFELVFSGHIGGDGTGRMTSVGDAGNVVHQMLIDTQFEENGGNGWFRLVEFLNDKPRSVFAPTRRFSTRRRQMPRISSR